MAIRLTTKEAVDAQLNNINRNLFAENESTGPGINELREYTLNLLNIQIQSARAYANAKLSKIKDLDLENPMETFRDRYNKFLEKLKVSQENDKVVYYTFSGKGLNDIYVTAIEDVKSNKHNREFKISQVKAAVAEKIKAIDSLSESAEQILNTKDFKDAILSLCNSTLEHGGRFTGKRNTGTVNWMTKRIAQTLASINSPITFPYHGDEITLTLESKGSTIIITSGYYDTIYGTLDQIADTQNLSNGLPTGSEIAKWVNNNIKIDPGFEERFKLALINRMTTFVTRQYSGSSNFENSYEDTIKKVVTKMVNTNPYAFFTGENVNDMVGVLGELQAMVILQQTFGIDVSWEGTLHEKDIVKSGQDILFDAIGIQVKNTNIDLSSSEFISSFDFYKQADYDPLDGLAHYGVKEWAINDFRALLVMNMFNIETIQETTNEGTKWVPGSNKRFIDERTRIVDYNKKASDMFSMLAYDAMRIDRFNDWYKERVAATNFNVIYIAGNTIRAGYEILEEIRDTISKGEFSSGFSMQASSFYSESKDKDSQEIRKEVLKKDGKEVGYTIADFYNDRNNGKATKAVGIKYKSSYNFGENTKPGRNYGKI